MIKISNFSSYEEPRFVIRDKGTNTSLIVDKLLRKAVQLTEIYASDIIYIVKDYTEAVDIGRSLDKILVFRESGVTGYVTENLDESMTRGFKDCGVLQIWRLTYDPETQESVFIRVRL